MSSPAAIGSIWAIGAYQRFISPHKGFCCAHRACTGGLSCSAFAKLALMQQGFRAALPRIRERLIQCSEYATDPFKGKINEDDPGPLTSDHCRACGDSVACAGCFAFDPFFWWSS